MELDEVITNIGEPFWHPHPSGTHTKCAAKPIREAFPECFHEEKR